MTKAARRYDFNQHSLMSSDERNFLLNLFKNFLHNTSEEVSQQLQIPFKFSAEEIELSPFFLVKKTLTDTTLLTTLHLYPYEKFALLTLESSILHPLIKRFLGLKDASLMKSRAFSPLEHSYIRKLIHLFSRQLNQSWQPLGDIDFAIDLVHPSFHQFEEIEDEQLCCVLRAKASFRDVEALTHLIFPIRTLLPMLTTSAIKQDSTTPEDSRAQTTFPEYLKKQIPVNIDVIVGRALFSNVEWNSLEIGDIIVLDQLIQNPVLMRIGNQPYWQGHLGLKGTHKGVLITPWQKQGNSFHDE